MEQIAIIGPTACGKTALAFELALEKNAYILSLDSLSIYKEVDIASAKPSKKEQKSIKHFGINEIFINEDFDVSKFAMLYENAINEAKFEGKNLILVGGSSFYLKMLCDGISKKPKLKQADKLWVEEKLRNENGQNKAYEFLYKLDEKYMKKIKKNDAYRIKKCLEIYAGNKVSPSEFFKQNPQVPILENLEDLKIFEIVCPKEILTPRIKKRTKQMLEIGLIDEVLFLENKYSRSPKPMGAIGIVETLSYLDNLIDKKTLEEKIIINTLGLAKRQKTFNASQFDNIFKKDSLEKISSEIFKVF